MKTWIAVVACCVALLVVGTLAGYIYGVSSAPTRTTTTTTTTTEQAPDLVDVSSALTNHLLMIASRNFTATAAQYEPNATVHWTHIPGFTGQYDGSTNIRILFNSFWGSSAELAIGNLSLGVETISSDSASVTSSFDFMGASSICGNYSGAISAEDSFVVSPGTHAWLIEEETWNFTRLAGQFPGSCIKLN